MSRVARALARTVAVSACVLLAACGSSAGAPAQRSSTPAPASTTPTTRAPSTPATSSSPTGSPAAQLFARMTLAERVGQLLMVDSPSTQAGAATITAIAHDHVGSVILDGTTTAGRAAVRAVTAQLEDDNPSAAKLFIATDQEGGEVQRLQGPGFSTVPSGLAQGQLAPTTLQQDATTWGTQLRAAGVNVDLAPVLDTVPANSPGNPPIGDLDREYGHTPAAVTAHGVAVAVGLADAKVVATVKHFPGLGRVAGNTDTTSGVTDSVTTRTDDYLAPFHAAVGAGVPFVMMSTAIYSLIDPGTPAAFSKTIVTGMLRHDLGFSGVVISDDLGAAKQVSSYSVGDRAVRFVEAGGDIVLTVDATQAATMTQALIAKAQSDPAFRALVDAAVMRVLQAKQTQGLLS